MYFRMLLRLKCRELKQISFICKVIGLCRLIIRFFFIVQMYIFSTIYLDKLLQGLILCCIKIIQFYKAVVYISKKS